MCEAQALELLSGAVAGDAEALASLVRVSRGSGGGALCSRLAVVLRRETLAVVAASGSGGTSPKAVEVVALRSEAEFPVLPGRVAQNVLQPRRKG